jgi:hypothetical protein
MMKTALASDEADLEQVGETFDCDPTFEASCSSSEPHLLTQANLNYLVRDLNLSKKEDEIPASRFKDGLFSSRVLKYVSFRNRQDEFKCPFSQENDLVFCSDICSVMEALGHQHNAPEWRLFIDSKS